MFKHFVLISIFLLNLSTLATAFSGDLDTFFGTGGIATVNAGRDSFDQAFAAAQQPDGKTVIVGDSLPSSLQFGDEPASFIVSRINVDGSLDTTFGAHGFTSKRLALSLSRATSVAIQTDGKIVVGGYTIKTYPTGNKRVFMLVRLNQNGIIDTTYGTNGFVTMDLPDFTQASLNALAIQADGKVVAAGYSYVGASGSPQSFAAARFNTDGSLDTGFDGDGKVFVDVNPTGNRGNAVAIQVDGKIVIGGLVRETGSSVTDFGLVRLNADGSLDSGFDGDGKLTTKFTTTTTTVLSLRVLPDGKIVAAGNSTLGTARDIAVARYNPDGSLDTSFDTDGRVTSNFGDETVGGISLQSDGKILVSGRVSLTGELFNLLTVRYNTDGSLDNTFDTDGKIITPVPNLVSFANAVMVRPDGKIVLGGTTGTFLRSDFVFARYNTDGSPDTSFDTDGISVVAPPNASDLIHDMALQPDGKIVTAGTGFGGFYLEGALARFLPDGSIDTSFGTREPSPFHSRTSTFTFPKFWRSLTAKYWFV